LGLLVPLLVLAVAAVVVVTMLVTTTMMSLGVTKARHWHNAGGSGGNFSQNAVFTAR
jgi:hypothetical protein